MNILHEKSPCCQGKIRRFGKRRRQCGVCKKTWRVWKKKRGRDHLKPNVEMVVKYFSGYKLVSRSKINREYIRRRLNLSLNKYLKDNPWKEPIIQGPLIVIVDAMWHTVENLDCTVYLALIRAADSNQSWILPPVIVPGQESAIGWQITLENIPNTFKKRIKALVCDGYPHLVYHAKQLGFLIQRCHFHLIASIKNYVTTGPLSHNQSLGKMILTATQIAINTPDPEKLVQALDEIWMLIKLVKSKKLNSRLRGFLRDLDDFRTYRIHSELNLPTTSNAAESLVQCVRDLLYRARGFRTAKSFIKWIKAICIFKKTIVCNGKYQPIKRV